MRPDSSAPRVLVGAGWAGLSLPVPPAELLCPVWVAANSEKLMERRGMAAASPEQTMGRDDPLSLMAPSSSPSPGTPSSTGGMCPLSPDTLPAQPPPCRGCILGMTWPGPGLEISGRAGPVPSRCRCARSGVRRQLVASIVPDGALRRSIQLSRGIMSSLNYRFLSGRTELGRDRLG